MEQYHILNRVSTPADIRGMDYPTLDALCAEIRDFLIQNVSKTGGHLASNRVAADDNPMKLMSIAMRPLSQPPFPLERIEEMTALMGGDGSLYLK